jgi:hypothetical protein
MKKKKLNWGDSDEGRVMKIVLAIWYDSNIHSRKELSRLFKSTFSDAICLDVLGDIPDESQIYHRAQTLNRGKRDDLAVTHPTEFFRDQPLFPLAAEIIHQSKTFQTTDELRAEIFAFTNRKTVTIEPIYKPPLINFDPTPKLGFLYIVASLGSPFSLIGKANQDVAARIKAHNHKPNPYRFRYEPYAIFTLLRPEHEELEKKLKTRFDMVNEGVEAPCGDIERAALAILNKQGAFHLTISQELIENLRILMMKRAFSDFNNLLWSDVIERLKGWQGIDEWNKMRGSTSKKMPDALMSSSCELTPTCETSVRSKQPSINSCKKKSQSATPNLV